MVGSLSNLVVSDDACYRESISLIEPDFGEEKAHSCDNACYQEASSPEPSKTALLRQVHPSFPCKTGNDSKESETDSFEVFILLA